MAILAHVDAGKTTLTEQLLWAGGALATAGSVDHGTTVTDWLPDEQRRGITINAAVTRVPWGDGVTTIVDTPGHVDFTGEVTRALRVVDGVVAVIAAPDGVQAQLEGNWREARALNLPALGFVNKIDRPGWDREALSLELEERLGIAPVWLTVPVPAPEEEVHLLDVLGGVLERYRLEGRTATRLQGSRPLSEELRALRERFLTHGVDVLSAHDDGFLQLALSETQWSEVDYLHALRRAVAQRAVLPLVAGVARAGVGVSRIGDLVCSLLPEPRPYLPQVTLSSNLTSAAYVFKTEERPRQGQLAFVRVLGGALGADQALWAAGEGDPVGRATLVEVDGAEVVPVATLPAGALGGLLFPPGATRRGLQNAILATAPHGVLVGPTQGGAPLVELALEAETADDELALGIAAGAVVADDPSLSLRPDPATGRLLLGGQGELHLEVAVGRVQTLLTGAIRTGRPRPRLLHVPQTQGRASIVLPAQNGGPPIAIELIIERITDFAGDVFISDGPALDPVIDINPPNLHAITDAIRLGISAAIGPSQEAPHRIIGAKVSVLLRDGVEYLSDLGLIRTALESLARRAAEAADLRPLAPWLELTITAPHATIGAIQRDLARRHARICSVHAAGSEQLLRVEGELTEFMGFTEDFRVLTAGRARLAMRVLGYRIAADKIG